MSVFIAATAVDVSGFVLSSVSKCSTHSEERRGWCEIVCEAKRTKKRRRRK